MSEPVRCEYIGCFTRIVHTPHNNGYCARHVTSLVNHAHPPLSGGDMKDMMGQLGTSEEDTNVFSRMLQTLDDCKRNMAPVENRTKRIELFDRIENLRQDIISSMSPTGRCSVPSEPSPPALSLQEKSQTRVRQKHTETRSSRQSRVHQKTLRKVKRIIREREGEKITEEHEETHDNVEKMETLVQFKTEQEVEAYVEETTERYETQLNEYAKNKELVFCSLSKWVEELAEDKNQARLSIVPIRTLLDDARMDLYNKHIVIFWRLLSELWQDESEGPQVPLPVLQQIVYYSIESFPDGPRKVFHCKFSDHKLSSRTMVVSVPEILLRAIPCYGNTIHAFFMTKFIPFKKVFMKYRRQLELAYESSHDKEVSDALDCAMNEEEANGFRDERFPEINPRVCYFVKK